MNTRNVYHIVTVEDGRADSEAILKVFSDMAAGHLNCDIKLLNYYREIPVSYNAKIVNVAKDRVELAVHQHQALVMKFDKHTLIKSKHFRDHLGVHCFAAYVNTSKEVAILLRFAYAQIKAERRKAVRVTVEPAIPAAFSNQDFEINGTMIDISESGISIISNKEPVVGENVQGMLSFTIAGTALMIPASFFKAIETDDGFVCVFQYQLLGHSEKIISHYIYTRQVEIIRELKVHI